MIAREKRGKVVKLIETEREQFVSRRSFLGAAAATVGAGTLVAPYVFGQSTTNKSKGLADHPANGSDVADKIASPGNRTAGSPHITSLTGKKPYFAGDFGSQTRVDASCFPKLNRLSIRRLLLAPRGVREPHWHANAHELGYCLRGEHLVTIAGNGEARNSFVISAGEMFFVPSGALHHVENIGTEEGEIVLGFSHERPEDFGLSGTFGCFSDAVLGNSFGLPASDFASLKRTQQNTGIGHRTTASVIELQDRENNPYKYSIEAALPQRKSEAGTARTALYKLWPALQDIAMFSVDLTNQGMRELHWHPETAEMGYVTQGKGRMTIVSPDGSPDTFEMNRGDVYFIPRAYPHHFEDIGEGDLKLLVFFDQVTPGDIGVRTVVGCYSREVLAATFKVEPSALPQFPFTTEDPLLVRRINAIDPSNTV
jgi:oxalate decarboxylase